MVNCCLPVTGSLHAHSDCDWLRKSSWTSAFASVAAGFAFKRPTSEVGWRRHEQMGRSNAMGVTADSSLMPVFVPRTGKRCRDSTQNAGRDDFKIPRALPRNPHLGPWHPSSLMWHQGKQRYVHTEFLPHTRRAGAPSFPKNTLAPPYPSREPRALRRG